MRKPKRAPKRRLLPTKRLTTRRPTTKRPTTKRLTTRRLTTRRLTTRRRLMQSLLFPLTVAFPPALAIKDQHRRLLAADVPAMPPLESTTTFWI